MQDRTDPERLQKWLADIVSTENVEVDCDALEAVLEQIVAVAEAGGDIRAILPAIAVHLDHCPECSEWYEALVAYTREADA